MTPADLLPDPVDAIEALAAGLPPDRLQAMAGAFALDSLNLETEAGLSSREVHELADAARGLYHIAAGGRCQIDAAGQMRIAERRAPCASSSNPNLSRQPGTDLGRRRD
jgi:hypothetical protein